MDYLQAVYEGLNLTACQEQDWAPTATTEETQVPVPSGLPAPRVELAPKHQHGQAPRQAAWVPRGCPLASHLVHCLGREVSPLAQLEEYPCPECPVQCRVQIVHKLCRVAGWVQDQVLRKVLRNQHNRDKQAQAGLPWLQVQRLQRLHQQAAA